MLKTFTATIKITQNINLCNRIALMIYDQMIPHVLKYYFMFK